MRINKKLWGFSVAVLITAIPILIHAQVITYVDTAFSIFVPKTIFGEINLSTCTDSLVEEELGIPFCYDMMVNSNGEIYGFGPLGGFNDTIFFLSLNEPGTIYWPPFSTVYSQEIRGLTCDENNIVYSAGKGISMRNTKCCYLQDYTCCDNWQETYLGTLPPDMQCLGDITYRKGKFYLSAIGNKLVEVNMKDPSKSQIIMDFPPGTLPIHGLTTVQLGCDSVVTYAIGRAWNHSVVYEINFDDWTLTQVCDMPQLAIDGAGNKTECALPPCDLFVDLDSDNSSMAFWGNYCAEPFCIPSISVTDTDVVILSMANTLDSINLNLTGILNGTAEYLETNIISNNLSVVGNGSTSLVFINNGTATLADFEAALKSVTYENGAITLTGGVRHVKVTGWSGGVSSIVSIADLPLNENVLQLTANSTPPSCLSLQDGSLAVQAYGGLAPYTFHWQAGPVGSVYSGIGAGNYSLTVMDAAGCIETDTFSLAEPDALIASITPTGPTAVCNNSASLVGSAIGGTPPYTYDWGNGVNEAAISNIGPGNYNLIIVDNNGCQASSSFSIQIGDSILINLNETICAGEDINWNGLILSADTTVCVVYTQANGCDSTACLTLSINPIPSPELTQNGSLCDEGEVILSVTPSENYAWSSGETSPTIQIQAPGIYTVTVANSYGCATSASIDVLPIVDFTYSVEQPACFGRDDGSIFIETVSGGLPPYSYSVDSINFYETNDFHDLSGGNYWATVIDSMGCKAIHPIILDTPQSFFVNIGEDESINMGESIRLKAVTNLTSPNIAWQPSDYLDCGDCISVTANPPYSMEYIVTVTDFNGCTAIDSIDIEVAELRNLYVPNAFSPNGDGINDIFTAFGNNAISIISTFQIYDKWGEQVFSTSDIHPSDLNGGWDGKFKGADSPTGTYIFFMEVIWLDGRVDIVKGAVNLIR